MDNVGNVVAQENLVHELGHEFGLSHDLFPHVDSDKDPEGKQLCHDSKPADPKYCIMSYLQDSTDGLTELCTDCLMQIRGYVDPL